MNQKNVSKLNIYHFDFRTDAERKKSIEAVLKEAVAQVYPAAQYFEPMPDGSNVQLCFPCILFYHTGNNESEGTMVSAMSNAKECWIVGFGAGDHAEMEQRLIGAHPEWANKIRFFYIPPMASEEYVRQRWTVKEFVKAVLAGVQNPFDYLAPSNMNLIALYFLCKEYLAAHGLLKGDLPQEVNGLIQRIREKEKDTEDPKWWKKVINKEQISTELLVAGQSKDKVNDLISTIFAKQGENQKNISSGIVEAAHSELKTFINRM